MILRLVFSFFLFSSATGNQRGHYASPPSGMVALPGYAYPVHQMNPQSRIDTKSYEMEYVSDEGSNLQAPRPIQFMDKESENSEKTICFTPSMVHRIIKAALEYVSQIPADINNIIAQLDQELNRMSDQAYQEDNAVKKPLYPLDSKKIFQMMDKPKSEPRGNLVLKYELPSVQEPQCREALEKLIEIAYTAYLELEKQPQCREYLYNFAAHQPGDHSAGQLDGSPDLRSLIATILDAVDKHKPKLDVIPNQDRFGGVDNPEIPQQTHTHEYNIQQTHEYNNNQEPQVVEYSVNEYNLPQEQDYNEPQIQEYNNNEYNIPNAQEMNKPALIIPKSHEYNLPNNQEYSAPEVQEYTITQNHQYGVPQVQEYTITQNHEYNVPQVQEYTITQNHEYAVPKVHEYRITDNHEYSVPEVQEYNAPQVQEYTITKNHEYNVPQMNEFTITQTHEYPTKVHDYTITQNHEFIPQIQDIVRPTVQTIEMPQGHETMHETKVDEVRSMQPEETVNTLSKLVQISDQPDSVNVLDRFVNILEENKNHFHPRILRIMRNVLDAQKQNKIYRLKDIILLLLDAEKNRDLPWNDRNTDNLLSYLTPDENGNLDSRIVEIILNLYKKRPNEKQVEYILSILRPLRDGKMEPKLSDIILKLINLHQNNLLPPDHVDILVKLLKPAMAGRSKPLEVDAADLLTRWNEIGFTPNQLNGLFALLKPYVNGHPDKRSIDIVHFLLTKSKHLKPQHIDFILSFLYPANGNLDSRRIDIIQFLLNNVTRYPKQANILLTLLQEKTPSVLSSRFLEALLFLDRQKLLTPELVEVLVDLIKNDVTGQLDDNQMKTLFFQLAPLKKSNPKLLVNVLTILNQDGLHGNIVDWFESTTNDVGVPNRGSKPEDHFNEYRVNDDGYQTMDAGQQLPDHDFISIFKWLDSQGLITQDQGSNTDLVNKILKILQEGDELGVVELTYMLKHEKPLIYQPVYYVKYRLPIPSFISNMRNLLQENPNLHSDPMKLLQELIVISNVTEVSPNLQGFPKDEILKLTFNDGDLVQAKILDEQNLNLNDQISYVHGLNSDISPEEILQLNKNNEAKYFAKLKEVKGVHPDQLTDKEIDQFVDIPPIRYKQVKMNPGIIARQLPRTVYHSPIARENQNP